MITPEDPKKFYIQTDSLFLVVVGVLAIIIALISVVHTNRVIARKTSLVTCRAFANQQDAQNAYNAALFSGDPVKIHTYRNLDKNHDGIACNDLRTK